MSDTTDDIHPGVRPPRPPVSNWGRWGHDDEIGTSNFITPAKGRRPPRWCAGADIFSLAIPARCRRSEREQLRPNPVPHDDGDRCGHGAAVSSLPVAPVTPTMPSSCRCSRAPNGTLSPTCTTTGSSTTAIRRARWTAGGRSATASTRPMTGTCPEGVLLDVARAGASSAWTRIRHHRRVLEDRALAGRFRRGGDIVVLRAGAMAEWVKTGVVQFQGPRVGCGLLHCRMAPRSTGCRHRR